MSPAHAPHPHVERCSHKHGAGSRVRASSNAHYVKGAIQEAYDAYLAAWALKKKYCSIAANLANVEARVGKYSEGAEHLRFTSPSYRRAERRNASRKIATAAIATNVDGADVVVDGAAIDIASGIVAGLVGGATAVYWLWPSSGESSSAVSGLHAGGSVHGAGATVWLAGNWN